MNKIVVSVIILVIVVAVFFVLKPNPEEKVIDALIRDIVDSVTARDVTAINDFLTEGFIASFDMDEISKEDFENGQKAAGYLREIGSINIRKISVDVNDDSATAMLIIRASSTKIKLDAPWSVNIELKKINGKWLFDKAKVINMAEKIKR